MAGAGHVPLAIVLAFGAGALGGAEALRLLRQFAGRSAAVDLATCIVVISLLTAPLLGTMLLACFARKERAGGAGAGAPAMEIFARVTATVSVGAALLVTACLVLVPGAAHIPVDFAVVRNPIVVTVVAICAAFGAAHTPIDFAVVWNSIVVTMVAICTAFGAAHIPVDFAVVWNPIVVTMVTICTAFGAAHVPIDFAFVWNPIVVTMVAICAAFAAAAAVHLRARLFRVAGSAGGPAVSRATKIKAVVSLVAMSSVVASFVASGGFDAHAQLLVPEFIWRMVTMPVGVAIAFVTVAGTVLLGRCSRCRARNSAGAGGGAAAARTS